MTSPGDELYTETENRKIILGRDGLRKAYRLIHVSQTNIARLWVHHKICYPMGPFQDTKVRIQIGVTRKGRIVLQKFGERNWYGHSPRNGGIVYPDPLPLIGQHKEEWDKRNQMRRPRILLDVAEKVKDRLRLVHNWHMINESTKSYGPGPGYSYNDYAYGKNYLAMIGVCLGEKRSIKKIDLMF